MKPWPVCAAAWLLCASQPARGASADAVKAYTAQNYEEALQGFLQLQTEHPQDLGVAMNVGSAHYHLRQYDLAERAFLQATQSADPKLRAQALYNLGNTSYQRGKLDEAEAHYQHVLTMQPGDQDARKNLAYVRKVREQRQKQANEREQQDKQSQAQKDKQQQEPQAQAQQQAHNAPNKSDKEANRGADAGKTQSAPKKPQPPAADAAAKEAQQGERQATQPPPEQDASRRQAERYLDSLSETRPKHQTPPNDARQQPNGSKDW